LQVVLDPVVDLPDGRIFGQQGPIPAPNFGDVPDQTLRDAGSQIRDAATEKVSQLRDQAGEYYEQGKQRAQEWEQGLEEYIREKPVQSLLIAAGVGMLLGILWKRS